MQALEPVSGKHPWTWVWRACDAHDRQELLKALDRALERPEACIGLLAQHPNHHGPVELMDVNLHEINSAWWRKEYYRVLARYSPKRAHRKRKKRR